MEIQQNKFMFFANFAETIKELPKEKQGEAYQAICEYGIYGTLPEDQSLKMMCLMAKASIFKEDGRKNNGGNHNPTGKNQHSNPGQKRSILVNSGQSGQFLSRTETETEEETEEKKKIQKEKEEFDPANVISEWNNIATKINLATIRGLTPERKKKLSARLKEQNMTVEDFFREIKTALNESPFLRGKKWKEVPGYPNDGDFVDTDWRADFDFFLQPSSLQKALEGKYADPQLRGKFH